MKIRRYIAKNTQEAILKVKMDLGSEALILNTRKVRQKGMRGLFSKPMTEVLAAIDEYGITRSEGDIAAHADRQTDKHTDRYADKYADKRADRQADKYADKYTDKYTGRADEKENGALPEAVMKPEERVNERANEKSEEKAGEKEGKIVNLENKITNIEGMLEGIYTQMTFGTKSDQEEEERKPPAALGAAGVFYRNLIKNEVDPEIARYITETAAAKLAPGAGVSGMAAQVFNVTAGILGTPEIIKSGASGRPEIVIFVGPTGVGKTTTLAKIAARYLLNQKKSIGLITADTYRIAAAEQLKTYGEILGIPVSVAYTPADVREAINRHSDKDIIFIDTAGRSHRNKEQFEELKALIAASGADEIYLVLSATTSYKNCTEILESYDFLKKYRLIFTKTDETPVSGIILNVKYLTGRSLSYVANGQSVPDDIETANIEKITKNLIGSMG